MIKRLLTVFVLGLYFLLPKGKVSISLQKGSQRGRYVTSTVRGADKRSARLSNVYGSVKQPAAGQTLFSDEQETSNVAICRGRVTAGSFPGRSRFQTDTFI